MFCFRKNAKKGASRSCLSDTQRLSFINVFCSMGSRRREDGGCVRGERTASFLPESRGVSCVISILSQIYLPIRTTE